MAGFMLKSPGRDGSVGIATRDGLDGPGFESWWEGDFMNTPILALESTKFPVQRVKVKVKQSLKALTP
jgi:hypothetical protein